MKDGEVTRFSIATAILLIALMHANYCGLSLWLLVHVLQCIAIASPVD